MNLLPVIQNVVSFSQMQIEEDLPLKLIAQKVEGSRYNRKRFPAVIMRKNKPRSTVLCFKSGRMIIIGSQSQQDAEFAAHKAIKDIAKAIGIKAKLKTFRITNIVANADVGFRLQISLLCEERNVIKNQNFPGVVYKNLPFMKSVLIFASGKVVFTGAKSKDDVDQAYIILRERMKRFRVHDYK